MLLINNYVAIAGSRHSGTFIIIICVCFCRKWSLSVILSLNIWAHPLQVPLKVKVSVPQFTRVRRLEHLLPHTFSRPVIGRELAQLRFVQCLVAKTSLSVSHKGVSFKSFKLPQCCDQHCMLTTVYSKERKKIKVAEHNNDIMEIQMGSFKLPASSIIVGRPV